MKKLLLLLVLLLTACTMVEDAENIGHEMPETITADPEPEPLPEIEVQTTVETKPELKCNSTQLKINDSCCDDLNTNNVCDSSESKVYTDLPNTTLPYTEPTVNNYFEPFRGRQTKILFDDSQTTAPIVAAAINFLAYYNYENQTTSHEVDKYAKFDEYKDSNLILLGTGCNNNIIQDFFAMSSNCDAGVKPGKVTLKLVQVDSNYVLFVIGEDLTLYEFSKTLNETEFKGNEAEFDV